MKISRKKIGEICERTIEYGFFISLGMLATIAIAFCIKLEQYYILSTLVLWCLVSVGFTWGKAYKDDSESIQK